MTNFTKCIKINDEWESLNWTQYKSRNMYISEPYYLDHNWFRVVMSYNTIIGFLSMGDNKFITWGYSEYSVTTSKQITQLCYEQKYRIKKVEKYTHNDLKMLEYYLSLYVPMK